MKIGEKIAQLRKLSELTQEQLAEKLDVKTNHFKMGKRDIRTRLECGS